MPFPRSRCPVYQDHKFWWLLPQKEIKKPLINSVRNALFQLHPGALCSLRNLAWIKLGNSNYQRGAADNGLSLLSDRRNTWALGVALNGFGSGGSANCELLDHIESKMGFDRPSHVAVFSAKEGSVLYCFDDGMDIQAVNSTPPNRAVDYVPADRDYDYPPGVGARLPNTRRKRRMNEDPSASVSSNESLSDSDTTGTIRERGHRHSDDGLCIHCKGTGRTIPGYSPVGAKPNVMFSREGSSVTSYYDTSYDESGSPRARGMEKSSRKREEKEKVLRIREKDGQRLFILGPKNNRDIVDVHNDEDSSHAARSKRNEGRIMRNQEREKRRRALAKKRQLEKDRASSTCDLSTLGPRPNSSASSETRRKWQDKKDKLDAQAVARGEDLSVSSVSSLSSMSMSLGVRKRGGIESATTSTESVSTNSKDRNPIPAFDPQGSLLSSVVPRRSKQKRKRASQTISESTSRLDGSDSHR